MSHGHERPKWSELPTYIKRIIQTLLVICTLTVLADFFYHKHGHYPIEETIGFHAWYGFICCFMLVIVATQLRKILMRDEKYYDDEDSEPGPGNGEEE